MPFLCCLFYPKYFLSNTAKFAEQDLGLTNSKTCCVCHPALRGHFLLDSIILQLNTWISLLRFNYKGLNEMQGHYPSTLCLSEGEWLNIQGTTQIHQKCQEDLILSAWIRVPAFCSDRSLDLSTQLHEETSLLQSHGIILLFSFQVLKPHLACLHEESLG